MQQDNDGQNHTRTRNVHSIKRSGGHSHFKEPVSHSLDASTTGRIILRYIAFYTAPDPGLGVKDVVLPMQRLVCSPILVRSSKRRGDMLLSK